MPPLQLNKVKANSTRFGWNSGYGKEYRNSGILAQIPHRGIFLKVRTEGDIVGEHGGKERMRHLDLIMVARRLMDLAKEPLLPEVSEMNREEAVLELQKLDSPPQPKKIGEEWHRHILSRDGESPTDEVLKRSALREALGLEPVETPTTMFPAINIFESALACLEEELPDFNDPIWITFPQRGTSLFRLLFPTSNVDFYKVGRRIQNLKESLIEKVQEKPQHLVRIRQSDLTESGNLANSSLALERLLRQEQRFGPPYHEEINWCLSAIRGKWKDRTSRTPLFRFIEKCKTAEAKALERAIKSKPNWLSPNIMETEIDGELFEVLIGFNFYSIYRGWKEGNHPCPSHARELFAFSLCGLDSAGSSGIVRNLNGEWNLGLKLPTDQQAIKIYPEVIKILGNEKFSIGFWLSTYDEDGRQAFDMGQGKVMGGYHANNVFTNTPNSREFFHLVAIRQKPGAGPKLDG